MLLSLVRVPSPSPSPSSSSSPSPSPSPSPFLLPRLRSSSISHFSSSRSQPPLRQTLALGFPAAKVTTYPSSFSSSTTTPQLLCFMSFQPPPHPPPASYRPNVGLCLINSHSQVFIARRIDLPEAWQMPQGGVDENEEPRVAALRELKEETGVTSVQLIGEAPDWLTYDFPPDVKEKITHLWGKEWKGQAQKWFLFRFVGDESEIILDGDEKERAEFSEWKWASTEEVLRQAVDFKRPVYEKVFKAFGANLT